MLNSPVVRGLSAIIPCVLAGLLVAACGDSEGSEVEPGNGSGATGSGGKNGQPTLGGSTGFGGSGNNGSSGSGTITPGSECAKGTATADAIPAVVQMVVDTSGSMDWGADGGRNPRRGESKWEITSAALKEAVAKLPATVAVGINFFPNNPRDGACIRNRVDLPIALLEEEGSMQRERFNDAIDDASPRGGTPTHGAFVFGAETVTASNLSGKKFVLLITDGDPTWTLECEGDGQTKVAPAAIEALVQSVADTYTQDGVSTFVIGSPGSEGARTELSRMASEGGTARAGCSDSGPEYCHLDMTTADDFAAALRQGLAEVAGAIGTCEYAVPDAPPGQDLDPTLVNVLYTKGDGSQVSIPKDAAGDCASGWKYDDEASPTKITLCGADCDAVEKDTGGRIDVIFGCLTETNVPK